MKVLSKSDEFVCVSVYAHVCVHASMCVHVCVCVRVFVCLYTAIVYKQFWLLGIAIGVCGQNTANGQGCY